MYCHRKCVKSTPGKQYSAFFLRLPNEIKDVVNSSTQRTNSDTVPKKERLTEKKKEKSRVLSLLFLPIYFLMTLGKKAP